MFYSFPFLLVEHSGETSLCVLWLFLTKCLYFESKNFGDLFVTARTNTQVHFWFSLIILHTVAIFTLWIQFSLLLRFIWCQPFAAILLMISWFDAKWFKRFVTLFCKTKVLQRVMVHRSGFVVLYSWFSDFALTSWLLQHLDFFFCRNWFSLLQSAPLFTSDFSSCSVKEMLEFKLKLIPLVSNWMFYGSK